MKKIHLILISIVVALSSAAADKAPREVTGWNHFAWGAEIGGAIDMTSNDLSNVSLNAFLGYRNSWIDLLGVGAEVDMMVSNSVRSFPVYAMFRTSFTSRPSLVFMDLRGGVVFNNLTETDSQTSAYISPGLGFNLAGGKSFQSYITLSYVYNAMRPFSIGDRRIDVDGLSLACLRLGIIF
ncbi:MAG: hypothetical protein HDS53_07010 [Barnesiella sp.]|nr:hypothetical protein [Barnesiella sp.]